MTTTEALKLARETLSQWDADALREMSEAQREADALRAELAAIKAQQQDLSAAILEDANRYQHMKRWAFNHLTAGYEGPVMTWKFHPLCSDPNDDLNFDAAVDFDRVFHDAKPFYIAPLPAAAPAPAIASTTQDAALQTTNPASTDSEVQTVLDKDAFVEQRKPTL